MTEHEASRTLVKSTPELWAECSDGASLARHLGQFGEIRITRLEPETAVAWEGEEISGTVRLEPSGWGTKVILTARRPDANIPAPAEIDTAVVPEPAPVKAAPVVASALAAAVRDAEPAPIRMRSSARPSSKRGAFGWLRDLFGSAPVPERARVPDEAPVRQAESEALPEPEIEQEIEPRAEVPLAPEPIDEHVPPADEALAAALDSLGQAHHRPFSRG
jgi:hypothetical protein